MAGYDVPGVGFTDIDERAEVLVVERGTLGRQLQDIPVPPVRAEGRHSRFASAFEQTEIPRGGELRAKLAEDKLVPMPLKHTDVKAQIAIYLASVTVTQKYHNPYDGKIEAVYVFPLPEDAAVRDFILQIGERQIRGIIREREEARKIYLEARRRGHVATLLEQDRPNIFIQSVANIEPGKQIDVRIAYFHTLKFSGGEYEWHFPMVVGPRFNPPGFYDGVGAVPHGANGESRQATEVQYLRPDEISAHHIAVEADIDAGVPISRIESPSHVIEIDRPTGSKARVRLAANDRIPNRDFVLRYRVADREIRAALAVHRETDGGYFTLVLHPPDSLRDVPATPREMVFVVDCSGSMSGEPLAIAKRAVERALKRLGPNDTFLVIRFSNGASAMSERPLAPTRENVERALRYIESVQAGGGTMLMTALQAALGYPKDPERYRIVSFLTDGYIGNDVQVVGAVRQIIGDARIFSFGIGSSVNRYLLEGLARAGRGACAIIGLDESVAPSVDKLYERIEHPAMTDLRLVWSGGEVLDVRPDSVPDLFVDRPVVVTGRFRGRGPASVAVRGRVGGQPREMALAVDFERAPAHPALPAFWARVRIGELHDRLGERPGEPELVDEIRALALRYGLASEFTSFIAVDSLSRTEGGEGTTVPVAVPVPKGVKYETTVSEK